MAIKGISEVRRLPRIGKIRLGIKKQTKDGKSDYPAAVDYFVCNGDQSTSDTAAAAFHAVYGEQPKVIDVLFPTEDKDKFFPQFYRRYGKGTGLICKGDGETAVEMIEGGAMQERKCEPATCEWAHKKHCRPVGSLQFLLPEVPGLGTWQIDTSSWNTIVNLNSALDFVRSLTGGRISMIPLKLVVHPKDATVEGKKKVIYVLDIASDQMKLSEILADARKPLAERLGLPEVSMDEAPDDLYPESVLDEPLQTNAPAQLAPHTQQGNEMLDRFDARFEGDKKRPTIDERLDAAWDYLGTLPAKRKAVLASPILDKDKLLAGLEQVVTNRKNAKILDMIIALGGQKTPELDEAMATGTDEQRDQVIAEYSRMLEDKKVSEGLAQLEKDSAEVAAAAAMAATAERESLAAEATESPVDEAAPPLGMMAPEEVLALQDAQASDGAPHSEPEGKRPEPKDDFEATLQRITDEHCGGNLDGADDGLAAAKTIFDGTSIPPTDPAAAPTEQAVMFGGQGSAGKKGKKQDDWHSQKTA
jgi:hypothetical protein